MNICIDLDDTITDTRNYLEKKKKSMNKKHGLHYKFSSNYATNNIEYFYSQLPLKKNALETINLMKDAGHKIYIIANRKNIISTNIENITINYLDSNGFLYDEFVFGSFDKKQFCLDNDIDILIDNNIDTVMSLRNTSVTGILFDDMNLVNGIIPLKISNWDEIYKYVDLGGKDAKKSIVKRRGTRRRF